MLQDFSRLIHRRNRHEIGRNQERKNRGIVRRAEQGSNETNWLDRSSETIPAHGIEGTIGHAGKVVSLGCFLALLLMEGLEDISDSLHPVFSEDGVIACYLPVLVSEADRITERVYLILALENLCLHLGIILLPTCSGRSVIIGIGITVDIDALQLAQDDTTQHLLQFLILVGKGYIWPNLST